MMNRTKFLILLLTILIPRYQVSANEDDILWYDEPATEWEEALPLGNGRLGVMVFGSTLSEHLQLNDDSLWPDDPGWEEPAGNKEDLQKIRELLFKGDHVQADQLFVEKFSNKSIVRSHQTLGDLHIDFGHDQITDYKRTLNLADATATVEYKTNGFTVREKIFVSHPHQVIVLQVYSDAKKGLNGKIRLSRPMDEGHPTVTVTSDERNQLIMRGMITQHSAQFRSDPAPITSGVKFETRLQIYNVGGKIRRGTDYLELRKVKTATFYLVSNSSYYEEDYSQKNREELANLEDMDFEKLHKTHVRDFREYYDRMDLKLGGKDNSSMPTDERLNRVKQGDFDPGLEALLFQYGRYLLISSSRPGTNPANLQGLWNQHITAPWNADYHLNINLQMNYWLADMTNLSELNEPLFDFIDLLIDNGKKTAEVNFGCRGAFMPHATDLWAPTWLRAATAYWGCSLGAGGWMMQHYWDHYAFTSDEVFLQERAYPAIREVAQFYSDWIIEDPRDGTLISAPSTSPENRFLDKDGEPVATCLGSAMDQQVIAEVFDHFIQASEILNLESDLLDTIRIQRKKLRPGFVIGSEGRILEWDREHPEMEPGHRHMSHLYGFHPGTYVTKEGTPDIFEAVRKTLDYRLANGGAGTGWSRAWLINCAARLLDGRMAHEHIQMLFSRSIFTNLFDAHPPFQIDGNFGYTAGVAEMLLQTHEENMIRLLPALPPKWESGSATGLKGRGNIEVDLHWKDNRLEKAVIRAGRSGNFRIVYGDKDLPVNLMRGRAFTFRPD